MSLLSTAQLADELSISRRTLEAWRLSGTGPRFVKIGRLVRYRRATIDAWLAKHEKNNTSATGLHSIDGD